MRETYLTTWLRLQSMLWVVALVVFGAAASARASWLPIHAGVVLASFAALAWILRAGRTLADVVTIVRVLGVGALLWFDPFGSQMQAWIFAVGIAGADLLDGAIARRFGASEAGAVLDMEADQFAVLAFSLLVVARGGAPHVLLLPLMRYMFVLAAWRWSVPAHDPKPVDGDNSRGRLVCAAVVICLLLALAPWMPLWGANLVTGVAVLLLLWSFSSDWSFLFARRSMARERS